MERKVQIARPSMLSQTLQAGLLNCYNFGKLFIQPSLITTMGMINYTKENYVKMH